MKKQVLKNMILDQFVYILLLPQIISMVKKLLECYFMRRFFLLRKNLHSEMEKIVIMEELPSEWTYPDIQPKLLEKARQNGFV